MNYRKIFINLFALFAFGLFFGLSAPKTSAGISYTRTDNNEYYLVSGADVSIVLPPPIRLSIDQKTIILPVNLEIDPDNITIENQPSWEFVYYLYNSIDQRGEDQAGLSAQEIINQYEANDISISTDTTPSVGLPPTDFYTRENNEFVIPNFTSKVEAKDRKSVV